MHFYAASWAGATGRQELFGPRDHSRGHGATAGATGPRGGDPFSNPYRNQIGTPYGKQFWKKTLGFPKVSHVFCAETVVFPRFCKLLVQNLGFPWVVLRAFGTKTYVFLGFRTLATENHWFPLSFTSFLSGIPAGIPTGTGILGACLTNSKNKLRTP